jgi:predicted transcriptional regulator
MWGVVCGVRAAAVRTVCWHTMKRTTLKISDDLDARLRHEAERRGMTISEINREALEAYLLVTPSRRRLGAAAAGRSGCTDTSERIEEILATEVTQ